MPLVPGSRLGPYEILAVIGAGGMGEVYRARDTRLNRDVAIKVIAAGLADSPDALARFEREARAVAALAHPNILALHDVGMADGTSYAVTELVGCNNLITQTECTRESHHRDGRDSEHEPRQPPTRPMKVVARVARATMLDGAGVRCNGSRTP